MLERIRSIDREIRVVFGAVLLLGIGYGCTTSVLAIHLAARQVTELQIGWLATFFAGGICAMSIPAGWLVRRIGARKLLLIALAIDVAVILVFPHLRALGVMGASRFFDGAASACVWVACETIVLARARASDKALATSLYAMCFGVGYVIGPLLSKPIVLLTNSTTLAFRAAAVLAFSSLVVMSRLDPARDVRGEPESGRARERSGASVWTILWRIKTSCFATFAYGYFQASVVLFLPLYLNKQKNVSESNTVLITAFFAAGMLTFSAVAGRLGDRLGHLAVMRVLAVVGTTMIASFVWLDRFWLMCASVFVAGATLASISPVSLALQGAVIEKRDLPRANAVYNAFYAGGMLMGPPIASLFFSRWGGPAMLWHLAALWAGFAAFSVVFAADDPRVVSARRLGAEERR